MPDEKRFTITTNIAGVAKLQADYVSRYNQNTGENLTIEQWLNLHVKDLCAHQEVAVEVQRLQKEQEQQQQTGLDAAIRAAQDTFRAQY